MLESNMRAGCSEGAAHSPTGILLRLHRSLSVTGFFLLSCLCASAGPALNLDNPTRFFTNVASRLLRSELDVDFARIQIHPTNEYTPAVHRLLQVTANLYDASTNRTDTDYPYLPTVFRPLFAVEVEPGVSTNVYITGYEEVTNGNDVYTAPIRDLADPDDLANLAATNNVWGVPLIVGVKKGFPNFNEYAFENSLTLARRLEFRHKDLSLNPDDLNNPIAYTNQMYTMAVSNRFAVEAWNSWSNTYPRSLRLIVTNEMSWVLYTSNLNNRIVLASNRFARVSVTNMVPGTWGGFYSIGGTVPIEVATGSFQIPLQDNSSRIMTNAMFVQSPMGFGGFPQSPNIAANPFPNIRRWAKMDNRVRYILEDTSIDPTHPRILDYVSFIFHGKDLDLTSMLMADAQGSTYPGVIGEGDLWVTNRQPSTDVPVGIQNQILVSLGYSLTWGLDNPPPQNDIRMFIYNMYGIVFTNLPPSFERTNIFQAPYVAERTLLEYRGLQANDPLVHFTLSDLQSLVANKNAAFQFWPSLGNIGNVNDRYRPWGLDWWNPENSYNSAMKDPLRYRSDDWQFPSNVLRDVTQIGQVHRGTPWQSIYLKSADVDTNAPEGSVTDWQRWSGDADWADAMAMRPVTDWRVAGSIVALVNTNNPCRLLSVNNPSRHAWLKTLDGMLVETNPLPDYEFLIGDPLIFDTLVMKACSPEAGEIVDAIRRYRSTNEPGGMFEQPADVLAVPELSFDSPWLNITDFQQNWCISDEMYELIPSQLLPKLRPDSIGHLRHRHGRICVRFTGMDGCAYVVQRSHDLRHWVNVSTNSPEDGWLYCEEPAPSDGRPCFYRTMLLPERRKEFPSGHGREDDRHQERRRR